MYSQLRQRRWESQLQKYLHSSSDSPAMQLTENSVGRSEQFGEIFIFHFFFWGVGIGGWSFPKSSPFLLDRTFQLFSLSRFNNPGAKTPRNMKIAFSSITFCANLVLNLVIHTNEGFRKQVGFHWTLNHFQPNSLWDENLKSSSEKQRVYGQSRLHWYVFCCLR